MRILRLLSFDLAISQWGQGTTSKAVHQISKTCQVLDLILRWKYAVLDIALLLTVISEVWFKDFGKIPSLA